MLPYLKKQVMDLTEKLAKAVPNRAETISRPTSLREASREKLKENKPLNWINSKIQPNFAESNGILKLKNAQLTRENENLMRKLLNTIPMEQHQEIVNKFQQKIHNLEREKLEIMEKSELSLNFKQIRELSGKEELKMMKREMEANREEIQNVLKKFKNEKSSWRDRATSWKVSPTKIAATYVSLKAVIWGYRRIIASIPIITAFIMFFRKK
ncbi:Protein CBG25715 [Caenorhabditis briggsae]|uniref:Protein CBG25715 n=1 Tax=Caenorhabditis briggsae TaxID=6238 RepID=B6IGX8_CAEBR|nr:Protein CBG25715 [Caenorhabditis briggsae]CAR99158.1 Protein CBG25715 [Caenorhabditis briggsae]